MTAAQVFANLGDTLITGEATAASPGADHEMNLHIAEHQGRRLGRLLVAVGRWLAEQDERVVAEFAAMVEDSAEGGS